MKNQLLLLLVVSLAPCASAEQFAASGPGAAIPASGSGGGGIYPSVLPPNPAVSNIVLAHEVGAVYSIQINGLAHTSAGELQAVLRDPTGAMHNLFVRSGFSGTEYNIGDFVGGVYSFVGPGALSFPGGSNSNIPPLSYSQDFGDSGVPAQHWPAGTNNIFNTPMNSIFAPAGTWSLVIYDWNVFETGSFTGWTLNGERPSIAPLCFGDGTQTTACPCGNNGAAGHGCNNSASTGGAQLTASGTFTPDTIVLTSSNELPTALTIFIQGGWTGPNGIVFGDGVRCFAGSSQRLYVKSASGGAASAPGPGDLTIRDRSAQLGNVFPHGTWAIYQAYYRDANAGFCAAPTGNTFNISNALKITWP